MKTSHYGSDDVGGGPDLGASIFPHGKDWGSFDGHGKFVIDKGVSACQNSCHGDDLSGGSARSCVSCHDVYPHEAPDVWQGLTGHGTYVRDKGDAKICATDCHGADLKGGYDPNSVKSCVKCHLSYPHSEGWSAKGHGEYIKSANGDTAECSTMCHRSDVPAELKLKTCFDCHAGYPHEDKWELAENHGAAAKADINGCINCHKSMKTDCGSCHHQNVSDWVATSHKVKAKAEISDCKICHGPDLSGGLSGRACSSCHPYVPHDWKEKHHGKYVLTTDDKFSQDMYASNCKLCHGELYPLNDKWPSGSVLTDSGRPTCYNCHMDYPHLEYSGDYGGGSYDYSWYELTSVPENPNLKIRAHSAYLANNEHFGFSESSPQVVVEGCGGSSDGHCHNNARHFMKKKSIAPNCNVLCHAKKE